MIRVGNTYIGTSDERTGNNFRHGDVFVELDTTQSYILIGGSWVMTGIDVGHNHDDRYYQKAETYTKDEVDAIVISGGTIDWVNVLNKPDTATRWADWTEVTNKPDIYTKTEADALLDAKQSSIIVYYGDSPPNGTNEGDTMYWVNSGGTIRFAVWGATTSGGALAWRTVTLT